MIITERRVVEQSWYETEDNNTGWESECGWYFKDSQNTIDNSWEIVEHLERSKNGNPTLGIAEKQTKIKE